MEKIVKSDAEWKQELSPEEFEVTRHKATERAFTVRYWDHHELGFFTKRTEVLCAPRDVHVPTRQRYRINSASLRFDKKSEA